MALRKIDENTVPNLADFQDAVPKWESIQCRLVTPMYGGGVKSAEPDIQQPIRVTAIRGQLRFWWRLLASQKVFRLPENLSLRQAEFALWGGMNDGDESGKASAVFLRIKQFSEPKKMAYFDKWDNNKKTRLKNRNEELLPNSYVLFAMDSEEERNKTFLIDKGLTWDLEWYLDKNAVLAEKYQDTLLQVITTLRWWATFGGIGARTRRGCGAFVVEKSTLPEIEKPISATEMTNAGCQLAIAQSNTNDAMAAWKIAVQRLRDFRQGATIGRNKDRGYSLWKEANAIKSIVNQPDVLNQSPFARGMFGMPIIFNFIGQDIGILGTHRFSLQPENKERMGSPLIIKPIYQNKQWYAAALLLPYTPILKGQLKIEPKPPTSTKGKSKHPNIKQQKIKKRKSVYIWDNTQVSSYDIPPIKNNGGGDPLQAFMTYFAKSNKKK